MHSSVRSNWSAIFLLNPRAPLMVCSPSIRFPGKDHHAADRVADFPESFVLFLGEQLDDAPQRIPPRERGDDRIATQEELAKFRVVMRVHAAHGVIQIEAPTTWECLAPQELVVQPKCGAVGVRIPSRRVSPEVERGVDQHASAVYRRRAG
jgi:hypothetical protein